MRISDWSSDVCSSDLQVEAARTRVALAPGAAAQLVVDAARLVALGADDVQAAGFLDRVVALLPFGLQARAGDLVDRLAGLGFKVRQFGVQRAAEHDVGAAAGHVGGDGHRARSAGLGDDGGFAFVQLGVEPLVVDAGLPALLAGRFGYFYRSIADQNRLAGKTLV